MGPIALFDKSFLQSLSLDESVFFDHFFLAVICPIFYVETLADLEKNVRQGRTPEQEVGIIADKVPQMSGTPCAYHIDLAAASLFGGEVPMDGRIPTAGGRPVRVDGKVGFVHEVAPEAEAFQRWQHRQFLDVERDFARSWRETLNAIDLNAVAETTRTMGISPQTCKSLPEAKQLVDRSLNRKGSSVAHQINLALQMLRVPSQLNRRIIDRWRFLDRPSLAFYAPYVAHVLAVELFFQIALGANLISTADTNNRTDIAYLFYTPFCHVFVSSDNLHRRCAPHFLRKDQSFVWGPDLKADLNRLMNHYDSRPEPEKEQGLMRLAPTPPKDDKESLTVQLWDRHLLPIWRKREHTPKLRNPKGDAELVGHINRTTSAPALPSNQVDFRPTEAEFVTVQRSISKRKGNWWQLPKDIKG